MGCGGSAGQGNAQPAQAKTELQKPSQSGQSQKPAQGQQATKGPAPAQQTAAPKVLSQYEKQDNLKFDIPNMEQLVPKYNVPAPAKDQNPLAFKPPTISFSQKQPGPLNFNIVVGQSNLSGTPGSYQKFQICFGNGATKEKTDQETQLGQAGFLQDFSIVVQLTPDKEPASYVEKLTTLFKQQESKAQKDEGSFSISSLFFQHLKYQFSTKGKHVYLQLNLKEGLDQQMKELYKFVTDNYQDHLNKNNIKILINLLTSKSIKDFVKQDANIVTEILEGVNVQFSTCFPNDWQKAIVAIIKQHLEQQYQSQRERWGREVRVPDATFLPLQFFKQLSANARFQSIANMPLVFQNLLQEKIIRDKGNSFREAMQSLIENFAQENTFERALIKLLKEGFQSRFDIFANAPCLNIRILGMLQNLSELAIGV